MERADKKALGGGEASRQEGQAGSSACASGESQAPFPCPCLQRALIGSGQDAVPMACPLLSKKQ